MRNRDRETRTKWDDRSTLFPDGLRLKAPVRSQHQDVCRAHACRETTGMTTDHYTRSPDNFSLFFQFFSFFFNFHFSSFPSFSFIFFSFSFIFFHFSLSFLFSPFLSFSFIFIHFLSIFFHFLSFSFIFFSFFLSFFFIFFVFVFVGCSKSDFFWASISLRFLLTVLMRKINFWALLGRRGRGVVLFTTPLWALFSFFFPLFFLPFFFFFFVFFLLFIYSFFFIF